MSTKAALRGVLACGVLVSAAGPLAAQQKAALIVEGVALGQPALCPPCMSAWVVGVSPGAKVILQVTDQGLGPDPIERPLKPNELGLCFDPLTPSGKGNVKISALVDGFAAINPHQCTGPIQPNPADCPPEPWRSVTVLKVGRPLEVPVEMPGDGIARMQLHHLRTGEKARWERVKAVGRFSPRPAPHVTFDAKVGAGIYRAHFLDKEGKVREVRLVHVEARERPGPPVPNKP
jgi:hypothetical protein